MKLLQSCIIACSMYSKIPMPRVEWTKENMKYVMCFFPLVGVVIGLVQWGTGSLLLELFGAGLFFSCCMTLIPIVITGGIHLDGYLDTIDALSSYGDSQKKLQILKDPHAGAFAVIKAGCYFIFSIGIWGTFGQDVKGSVTSLQTELLQVLGLGYLLSRALSGYSVAAFKPAKNSGLVAAFHDCAHKRAVKIVMCFYGFVTAGIMLYINVWLAVAALCCASSSFLWHWYVSSRKFGGITGDLCGYFLQVCELAILTGVMLAARIFF